MKALTGSRTMVKALLICCVAFAAGSGVAEAWAASQPYWTGIPPGGYLQECAGGIVTGNNTSPGLIPYRSSYIEVEYSSGGYCNKQLPRSPGWLEAGAKSLNGQYGICNQLYTANNATLATWVSGSVAPCSGVNTWWIFGEVRYDHPTLNPKPLWQVFVPYNS